MKKAAIFFVALLVLSFFTGCIENKNEGTNSVSPAEQINWASYTEGMNEANETGKPVMIYFYSKNDELEIFSNNNVANRSKDFIMIKINVSKENNESIAAKYGIKETPYSIFISNGNISNLDLHGVVNLQDKILAEMHNITVKGNHEVVWLNYKEGMEIANKTGKPILLYFYFPDSQLCEYTEQYIFSNKSVIEKSKDFVMIRINIGKNESKNIMGKYNFQYILYNYNNNYYIYLPTVIFLDKNKRVLHRLITFDVYNPSNEKQSIEDFLANMDRALKGKIWGYDFAFVTLNGATKHLKDYRGKVVIIDMVELNCPYCDQEMIELEKLLHTYGNKIKIISLDIGNDPVTAVKQHYASYINKWIFGFDEYKIAAKYWVMATPTLGIFDKYGRLQYLRPGYVPAENLQGIIDEMI